MSNKDKTTIKVRAYPNKAESNAPQSNLTKEQSNALELANKNSQLEEVKGKLLEQMKINDQLRESLKQEQAKTAEMANMALGLEGKLKGLAELESKAKKVSDLEAKVKDLSELLGKISGIAATGKAG
jgi:hypothetical protein